MHSMLFAPPEAARTAQPHSAIRRITRVPAFVTLLLTLLCSAVPGFAQTFSSSLGSLGPTGLAITSVGGTTYLYVAEFNDDKIIAYNLTTGSTTPTVVPAPAGTFTDPNGILVDSATGDLFVTDRDLNRVVRVTNTGTVVWTYGTAGTGSGQFQGPIGIARDSTGAIYITEHGTIAPADGRRVQKFTVTGTGLVPVTTGWPVATTGPAYAVAVDSTDNVYIGDQSGTIKKYTSAGVAVPAGNINIDGRFATGLSFGAGGVLYSAQTLDGPTGNRVQRFPANSTTANMTFGGDGAGDGQFNTAFGVVVNSATNLAYVSDYGHDKVQVWNLNPVAPGDTTRPTVAVTNGATTASTVVFNVAFSETVTGVTSAVFTATGGGGVTASALTAGSVTGSGANYVVTVGYTGSGGTIALSLNATASSSVKDASDNFYNGTATAGGANTSTQTIAAVGGTDTTAPTITSFGLNSSTGTSGVWGITFSEAVTGVDLADFTGNVTGSATMTLVSVVPVGAGGTTYEINFDWTAPSGSGSFQLAIRTTGSGITDAAGNAFVGGGFAASAPEGSIVSLVHPTVATFVAGTPTPSAVNLTLNFSEAVTGVNASDFVVTGPAGATVGTVTGSGSGPYTVPVTFTTAGTYTVTLIGGSTANIRDTDSTHWFAGGTANASAQFTASGGGGGDTTPPTATITIASSTASSVTYQIVFNETVTGVDTADFTAVRAGSTGGTGTATKGTFTAVSGTTYTQVVNFTGTGGTVGLNLNATGTGIQDAAGNALAAGVTGPTHTVAGAADTTPPTATMTITGSDATSVTYQIVFNETVTGVDTADFTTVRAGSTGGTVSATKGTFTAVSGTTYTQVVNFTGTGGTVGLNLNASGTGIQDTAANALATGATGPLHTVAGGVDTTPPTAAMTITGSTASSVTYQIVFNEAVTGVDATDFTAVRAGSTGGTGTATRSTFTAVNSTTYTVLVNFTGAGGTVGLNLNAAGTGIQDTAANAIAAGLTGPTFAVPSGTTPDTTAPVPTSFVVVNNSAGSATFSLTFSEAVTGVDSSDFTTAGNGIAATVPVSGVMGSGSTYTVIANYTGTGSFYLTLKGSGTGIADAAGNQLISSALSSTVSNGTISPPPVVITPPPVFIPPPVVKLDQALTFTSPVGTLLVNQPIALNATANSGLPVTFIVALGNASISGNSVTLRDAEPVQIRAVQAGNASYNAASADLTIRASKGSQSINFPSLANRLTTDGTITLNATSSAGLPVTYTLASGPATLSGNVLTLRGAPGTVMIRATQAGNDSYNAATEVVRSFAVIGVGQQVFLGTMSGNIPFAAVVSKDNTTGVFVANIASGEAVIFRFNIEPNGSFNTRARSFSPSAVNVQSEDVPATAAAARDLTLTGTVVNGVIAGTITELSASFTATVQPGTGTTAALAGLYIAAIPGAASGDMYIVVGPSGQVYALAVTPSGVSSGTGTVTADGNVSVTLSPTSSIAATLDPASAALRGRLTAAGVTRDIVGLSNAAVRTDRLVNLSSRVRVTGGDASRSVIAGFVITGSSPQEVLIRAIGPGLRGFNVPDALDNPRLQLFDSAGRMVAENDDWVGTGNVGATGDRVGAFRLTAGSRDAAIVTSLFPGGYTAVVTGVNGNGVALIEVYDAATSEQLSTQQLVNISTRGFVDTGDGNLIAGFVITGNAPKRVLVRGVGAGLSAFNVTGVLADPVLRIYAQGNSVAIAENDNWQTPMGTQAAVANDIIAAAMATGAFPLTAANDAAVVITLMPGNYSAVVSGKGTATGAGLVEVYEIPNP